MQLIILQKTKDFVKLYGFQGDIECIHKPFKINILLALTILIIFNNIYKELKTEINLVSN